MKNYEEIAFEDSLQDDWSRDLGVREVPLENKAIVFLGLVIFGIGVLLAGRLIFLGVGKGVAFAKRADVNLNKVDITQAPRGPIFDRSGKVLADNRAVFAARLDVKEFLHNTDLQDKTLSSIRDILGISPEDVWTMIADKNSNLDSSVEPVVLSEDLGKPQLLSLKDLNSPVIQIEESYKRIYPLGRAFSTVLGYVGLVNGQDLASNPQLTGEDYVGKTGLENYYNDKILGTPGISTELRNAKGEILGAGDYRAPKMGEKLNLTIDSELQKYFYTRMSEGLASLGRTTGVGLAFNPQTGEVLSLISFPTFDNNIFNTKGTSDERVALLTSPLKPLFNRAVSGAYTPGSTIKPLVGVAGLTEGVMKTGTTVFSPGYMDVPNPYDPEHPSRFLDWRYQGTVDLSSALAQSSNVYFYSVGGGANGISGLGITRLREWWAKFGLGDATGIDLPGEAKGFLPSAAWKKSSGRGQWLLGDTYNASIGQGDLLITPVQLLDYISAIANGGKIWKPFLNKDSTPALRADLSSLLPEIQDVQKGMREGVTSPLGTSHMLNDLPFKSAGKTGSAQIQNNTSENAFFVGYAPYDNPQIALLVLIEHSKEGSLNAVPIAKDVLAWYYENRIKNTVSSK